MKSTEQKNAFDMFSTWYEYCLENGIEPESIVSDFGEMLLITNPDTIEKVQNMLDQL